MPRLLLVLPFVISTIAAGSLSAADSDAAAFTDPEKAGTDYELQGEYAGAVKSDDGDQEVGVQVIALGDGKFQAVGFIGGLPGDGWMPSGPERKFAEGQLEGDAVRFQSDQAEAVLQDGTIRINLNGNEIASLEKVHRQNPTLGAKPPEGAIVLFDGSSLDSWENAKLVDDKWLAASNASTKQKLGDHHLHIEFRTPFMPGSRGQARGNSGVYVQGRYEVQVLDSFGLEGKNNECGGIYSISEPAVNMCFPPLTWQTYDIDFTAARYENGEKVKNARITVKHNGVVIHKDVELTHGTPGRHPEGPAPESLFLQDHGNPVVFRNVWVVEK